MIRRVARTLLCFALPGFLPFITNGQTIGDFISVWPGNQVQVPRLTLPSTHTFHIITRTGDSLLQGGHYPPNFDFTGFVPIQGSSRHGYLGINSETWEGGMTVSTVIFDSLVGRWKVLDGGAVDFSEVVKGERNCSGAVTAWGTLISCEESMTGGDANGDGYEDIGWCTEIDPVTRSILYQDTIPGRDKIWKLGRSRKENATTDSAGTVLYSGADADLVTSFLFRFVPDVPKHLGAGTLYALRLLDSTGVWVEIPNATPAECSNTNFWCDSLGATSFHGIEDVEIGPDGFVYFANKWNGTVYRFVDEGDSVSHFEVFAGGGMSYPIVTDSGTVMVPWGWGNDNMAFDGEGNLWVLQDGDYNHIWVVRPGHTQASPRVEIFGRTPAGCEPTGITFSPDYQFLFMSIMHPSSANVRGQDDCSGQNAAFDRDAAIVISRMENLGTGLTHVAWTNFSATPVAQGAVQLDWGTSRETDVSSFVVQKSRDKLHYQPLDSVAASGGNSSATYSLLDPSPAYGWNYYRLVRVDHIGDRALGPECEINLGPGPGILEVYPNPVEGPSLYVRLSGAEPGTWTLKLVDPLGRTAFFTDLLPQTSGNIWVVDLPGLAPGPYFLQVMGPRGDAWAKIVRP